MSDPIKPEEYCGHPTNDFDGQSMKCVHSLPCPRHAPTAKDQPSPPTQRNRPEDIKPGDWVRFDGTCLAIVERRVEYSDGGPSDHVKILSNPWIIVLSDVLEVRRG